MKGMSSQDLRIDQKKGLFQPLTAKLNEVSLKASFISSKGFETSLASFTIGWDYGNKLNTVKISQTVQVMGCSVSTVTQLLLDVNLPMDSFKNTQFCTSTRKVIYIACFAS